MTLGEPSSELIIGCYTFYEDTIFFLRILSVNLILSMFIFILEQRFSNIYKNNFIVDMLLIVLPRLIFIFTTIPIMFICLREGKRVECIGIQFRIWD